MASEAWRDATLRLLALEQDEDRAQTATLLATRPARELQRRGVLVTKLRVAGLRTGLGGRSLVELQTADADGAPPAHRMRPGDLVAIEESGGGGSGGGGTAAGGEARVGTEGVLHRVQDRRLVVAVDGALPDELLDRVVRLVRVANDLPYRRMVQAVEALPRTPSCVADVVYGDRVPAFTPDRVPARLELHNQGLNASQVEAVRFALAAEDVALIHGPPGTGKTTTLVELLCQLIDRGHRRILCCGPSNVSVDNVVERLHQARVRGVVRRGHPARVLPSVVDSTLEVLVRASDAGALVDDVRRDMDATLRALQDGRNRARRRELYAEVKTLRRELRQREDAAFRQVLQDARVVCTTLSGAASHRLAEERFEYVVIDEVSQALEAECWIAALRGERLILCGDPLQLPPTVKSQKAAALGLDRTLFDRLQRRHGERVVRMLTIQYRFNELISRWASDELYGGRLQADQRVAARVLADLPGVRASGPADAQPFLTCPLYLIDTAGCDLLESEGDDGDSKFNEGEAAVAARHVRELVAAGVQPRDVAVITPYNAQVQVLQALLAATHPELEIGSVDGFQGREKEAVVLSLVRSNDAGEVGFLREDRRLNVAVTRARRLVTVVCDSATMEHHPFLHRLCEYFVAHGEVTSAALYADE